MLAACSGPSSQPESPNILWIVWDTVRADHLSLYGYGKATTPHLDEWARGARVYDDCVSAAPYTIASHASMFTGLPPTEHGASNSHPRLDDRHETFAERLRAAGYQTYLFSANPHVSAIHNFDQGFDVEEHPWDDRYEADALRIVAAKIDPELAESDLAARVRSGSARTRTGWEVKASGELARRGVEEWLAQRDPQRPFFAFLNYTEAHRPWLPAAAHRERMMTPEQSARFHETFRAPGSPWAYSFGLYEYSDDELDAMAARYDACLSELDTLLHELLKSLESRSLLDHTIVVLTSDHGEHLGEKHLLDHQYSLHEPLLRVPLVIRYADRFPPGRDAHPVMVHDLFPTLLELAGLAAPPGGTAVSLLAPATDRVRVSECPGVFREPFVAARRRRPDWDATPWEREIRALYRGTEKLIRWSDGERELYDRARDPGERENLATGDPARADAMEESLETIVASFRSMRADEPLPELPADHIERLRALGYVQGGADGGADSGSAR